MSHLSRFCDFVLRHSPALHGWQPSAQQQAVARWQDEIATQLGRALRAEADVLQRRIHERRDDDVLHGGMRHGAP